MSPLSYYSSINADSDSDDASPPEVLTVSTFAAAAVGPVGRHMFNVEGYSRLKCTHGETGSYLKSGEFQAGGHAWRIHCYLNGTSQENAGFVSLFLARVGGAAGSVVHAEFEFELVHQHGEALRWPSRVGSLRARRFRVGSTWGWTEFIGVEDLERSSWFLKDDCFAVRCTVTVVEELDAVEEAVEEEDMDRLEKVCILHAVDTPPYHVAVQVRMDGAGSFMCFY